MKRLLLILILTFSLQLLTRADDISDLEVDGLSIGDSLLTLYDKDDIEREKAKYYKSNKYGSITFAPLDKQYDEIQTSWKTSDKEYKIVAISGGVHQNDINKCYNKMEDVKNEFVKFLNIKPKKKISNPNPYGLYTYITFKLKNDDEVTISCYDYEDQFGYQDIFRIRLSTKDFENWITKEAYD